MSRPLIMVRLNGADLRVEEGTSVAAALLNAGVAHFRSSPDGTPRGPVCGMGTCQECRVTIDGVPHQRSCMIECAAGMRVETGGLDG
ncbi:MAG TPA: (2Fe-2S)-binding protein [Gemmatimonadaceae bacterium]|nr:(2Fe-2S)-binding protein [Gemmatimonadaceae bacterium]